VEAGVASGVEWCRAGKNDGIAASCLPRLPFATELHEGVVVLRGDIQVPIYHPEADPLEIVKVPDLKSGYSRVETVAIENVVGQLCCQHETRRHHTMDGVGIYLFVRGHHTAEEHKHDDKDLGGACAVLRQTEEIVCHCDPCDGHRTEVVDVFGAGVAGIQPTQVI